MTANEPAAFRNPPPPGVPPAVYLINPGRPEERQQGIITHSDWTVDGQLVTNHPGMPLERPDPLVVSGSSRVIVRIATASAPYEIEVRQFGGLSADGTYSGLPTAISKWRHSMSAKKPPELKRNLTYDTAAQLPGWDIHIPLPPSGDVLYMNVWVEWYPQSETGGLSTETHSCNWTVSARRGQAAAHPGGWRRLVSYLGRVFRL